MAVYYGLLALILALGFFLGRSGKRDWKKAVYTVIITAALTLAAGLRYGIGFDYFHYTPLFLEIEQTPWGGLLSLKTEIGFSLLTKALMLVSADIRFLYFCYALMMMALVGLCVFRGSEMPWLSFFCFVTLSFLAASMNLLRQTMAAFVFLQAIPSLKEKKIVPYMLLVLLAASIHKSALILIPVYFVAHLPLNRITGALYAAGTLLAFLFSDVAMRFVTQFVYKDYINFDIYYRGSAFAFVMIPVLLSILAVLMKKRLCKLDESNLVYVNLMIYGGFFSLMVVRHFILERFSTYFTIASILVLPLIVQCFLPKNLEPAVSDGKFRSEKARLLLEKKQEKERVQIYYSIVTGLCAVCFIHFLIGANYKFHNVYPYYSIFSEEAKQGVEIPYIPYWEQGTGFGAQGGGEEGA